MQVGLDVDAALMIGGVSLCHHNKVITDIIANLSVCTCVGNLMIMAYTSQFLPALRFSLANCILIFKSARLKNTTSQKYIKLKKNPILQNATLKKLQDGFKSRPLISDNASVKMKKQ